MGRGYLIKLKVLACLMLILSACSAEKLSKKSEAMAGAQKNAASASGNAEDTLRHYSLVADSIRQLEVPCADLKAAVFQTMARQEEKFSLLNEMNVSDVLEVFEVLPYNEQLVCAIHLEGGSFGSLPVVLLFFVDTSYNYLGEGVIEGATEDSGTIQIVDVDNDSESEIVYTVKRQGSNLDIGSRSTSLYDFSEKAGLNERFTFVDSEWECEPKNPNPYDSIHRDWLFISSDKIKITEEKWWRDCAEKGEGNRNVIPELVSREHAYFYWDARLEQYVPKKL